MVNATLAFGVEPGFTPYRLQLARYPALAETVAEYVQGCDDDRRVDLLDIGLGSGRSRRYIEIHPGSERIRYHGVDRFPRGKSFVYRQQDWQLHEACLEQGLPFLATNRFDIVLCEQVLEHLHHAEQLASEMIRVLRPNGLLIVGVPIFPHGIHALRKHAVMIADRGLHLKKRRTHCRAFSLRTFRRMLLQAADRPDELQIAAVRGFRILSGGRPLEYYRWWWRLNCRLGRWIPSLCIEAQIVAYKRPPGVLPYAAQRRDTVPDRQAG